MHTDPSCLLKLLHFSLWSFLHTGEGTTVVKSSSLSFPLTLEIHSLASDLWMGTLNRVRLIGVKLLNIFSPKTFKSSNCSTNRWLISVFSSLPSGWLTTFGSSIEFKKESTRCHLCFCLVLVLLIFSIKLIIAFILCYCPPPYPFLVAQEMKSLDRKMQLGSGLHHLLHLCADIRVGHNIPVATYNHSGEAESAEAKGKEKDYLLSSYCARHGEPCFITKTLCSLFTAILR